MKKLSLFVLLVAVFGCNCLMSSKKGVNFVYDSSLTLQHSDTMFFTKTGHKRSWLYPLYADTPDSYVSVSGDTLLLCISPWRTYKAKFYILPDTAYSRLTYNSDDSYFKDYMPATCSIRVDKKTYQPGEYLTIQVYYEAIGKSFFHEIYDSVTIDGKIRLIIRGADDKVKAPEYE